MTQTERLHIWRGRAERAEARMAELEFEALLVERKAVKYWRTEYLRVLRERDEAREGDEAEQARRYWRDRCADLENKWREHTITLPCPACQRREKQRVPQREGDYL